MKGAELNRILNIGAKHALYREDGEWYHHLIKFPGVLFDKYGYLVINTEADYLGHPELQHGVDLHVKNGISGLKDYIPFSGEEMRKMILTSKGYVDEESIRIIRQVGVIERNIQLVKKIKNQYDNTCQICGTKLKIKKDLFYSEVHHIKPLGSPHNGPDKLENMICVCPNHHVLLDMGAIELELDDLQVLNHKIGDEFISYHNIVIREK